MYRVVETIMNLVNDEEFLGFQNDLSLAIYNGLGKAFSANENEVSLVTRLCDITNDKSHGPISIYSQKIHGGRSYVEFNYMDKPVTKELGDMAVITIVSRGRERLLQKLCLIQNKKGNNADSSRSNENYRWDIDLEQLYLLKNFPKLSGNKGIFKHCRDVSFRNHQGSLGAFGLLHFPGDMIFLTAPLLTELMKGKRSLNASDISVIGSNSILNSQNNMGFPFLPCPGNHHPKEFFFLYEELWHHLGGMWPNVLVNNMPFFGNTLFARDIYGFVRSWTQGNIGETCYCFGKVVNTAIDNLANTLLRQIGFTKERKVDVPSGGNFGEFKWEGELGVMVVYVDIDKEIEK